MLSPLAELRAAAPRCGWPRGRTREARALRRRSSSPTSATWTGSAARACCVRARAALEAGLLDERYLHVRGGRGLLRRARARAAAAILFTPRGRGRRTCAADRSRRGAGAGSTHYDRSHLAFYEKHRPGWAPCAAALAAAPRPARSDRITAERLLRIAIDARKLHDYGIGTYVRNLVRELARQDDDDRVRAALPARTTSSSSAALGPRFEPLVERVGQLLASASSSACRWRSARARVDLFHAPHYVVSPLTTVPATS